MSMTGSCAKAVISLSMFAAAACGGGDTSTPGDDGREPPAVPEGFVAVGEDGVVMLGWGYPAGTLQRGVHVYWGPVPGDLTEYIFVPSPRTRHQLGGLVNGQTYGFALTLEHATGAVSERTSTKLVVPRPLDLEPPTLVAIEPDPRATLAPDGAITFELSETMSLASFSVEVAPERALARPRWDASGRRVTILPEVPWQAGTHHQFRLEGTDLAGNTLTSTSIGVVTGLDARAPNITGFSPPDGMATVSPDARISVSFDVAMDVESVVRAFEVHPNPGCVVTSDPAARTFTCTPSAPLTAGGFYGVLVRTRARSVAGVSLERETGIVFTVDVSSDATRPRLVASAPEPGTLGVERHFELVLTFDVAMDRASTEAALAFPSHPGLTGAFTWSDQGRVLHFLPDVDPPHGARVAWTLGADAKSLGGVAVAAAGAGDFRVVRRERQAIEAVVALGGTVANPVGGAGPAWVDEGTSVVELGRVARRTMPDDPLEPGLARGFLAFDLSSLPENLTALRFAELELEEMHRAGTCGEDMGWRIESIAGGPALTADDFSAPVLTSVVCAAPTECASVPLDVAITDCPETPEGRWNHAVTSLVAADWKAREAQAYLAVVRLRMAVEDDDTTRRIELLTAHPWVPERYRPRLVVEYEVP